MTIFAAIQLASGSNVQANLRETEKLIGQAADSGAGLVVLPENFALMSAAETDKLKIAEPAGEGPVQEFLSQQAKKHELVLVGGTIPLKTEDPGKVRAACLLFDEMGRQCGRYDKMHLFDVRIPETGDEYVESSAIEPGELGTTYDTTVGKLGLSVCYDVRFPEYMRALQECGMDILAVPSAFTAQTGRAHWETLLRARAIENLCFVVAAAQGGFHVGGRETWGHSMIVNPWGNILNSLAKGPGVVTAEINWDQLTNTRKAFPVLEHRRIRCK